MEGGGQGLPRWGTRQHITHQDTGSTVAADSEVVGNSHCDTSIAQSVHSTVRAPGTTRHYAHALFGSDPNQDKSVKSHSSLMVRTSTGVEKMITVAGRLYVSMSVTPVNNKR